MNDWRTKFQDDPISIGLCQTSRYSLSPALSLLALAFPLPFCLSASVYLLLYQFPQLSLLLIFLAILYEASLLLVSQFFFSLQLMPLFYLTPFCLSFPIIPFLHLSFLTLYLFLPLPHLIGPSIFICPPPYHLPTTLFIWMTFYLLHLLIKKFYVLCS